jgi:hypothetical protein
MLDPLEERVGNGLLGTLCGAIYGLGLLVPAVMLGGWGHGSFLLFSVFGAPLSYIPFLGFFAPLILWPLAGFLLGVVRHRAFAIALLGIHLAGAACVLRWGSIGESSSEQWEAFARMRLETGGYADMGVSVYVIGQVVAWALALVPRRVADR